jgi:phage terminase large subunit GpA-like protein
MSENSSPLSQTSEFPSGEDDDLTADLDLGFDGAEDILRQWRKGMLPDPDLTVSEWADQHRWLSSRASAEPGRYRTARTPYLREIMDALSPRHPAQRISFMKAAQVGATEAGNNWIGFVIHHAPGPMLAVLPTVEMAKRTSRGRLDPLIADSPALRERVQPARSRDAGNSMLSKEFPGGILVLTGANSATGLRSMPARYIFLDEVDAYPASAVRKAIRSRWQKRGPRPSRTGARCSWSRPRPFGASAGSSESSRPATSAATSCPARIAG